MFTAPLHESVGVTVEESTHQHAEIAKQLLGLGDGAFSPFKESVQAVIHGRVAQRSP